MAAEDSPQSDAQEHGATVEQAALEAPDAPLGPGPEDHRLVMVIVDQPLPKLLREIGVQTQIPVHVSDAVDGRVAERRWDATPRQILDELASDYGLQWYDDGQAIFVSDLTEARSAIVPLQGNVNGAEFIRQVKALGLADDRYGLYAVSNGSLVRVSGPPRYVEVIREAANYITSPAAIPPTAPSPAARPAADDGDWQTFDPNLRVIRGRTAYDGGG